MSTSAPSPIAPSQPLVPPAAPLALPSSALPLLFVVVDTEEEFDWHAPYNRAATSVTAMRHIGRAQTLFDRYDLKPTYVIDYPVAHQPEGHALLREYLDSERCTIGAHLHPWVTPPHDELVNARNSFGFNLPRALEAAKIRTMVDVIQANLGIRPKAFKAGRYGIGASTVDTLEALGFEVDLSVNPHMDFSREQGPSFDGFDARPFLLRDRQQPMLFLPCTGGFVGAAGPLGPPLHKLASAPALTPLRAVGVLSRLGITNKVMLSPEGNTLEEMKALARTLYARGLRTFSLTFHSPSVQPGHTPYVRSDSDLREFLARIDAFCDFFFRELGGVPGRPLEFRATLLEESSR